MTADPQPTLLASAGPADPPSPPSAMQTRPAADASDSDEADGPPAARPAPDPPVAGAVLCDRYQLVAPLGQGGMGAVWRATHTVIGKQVAVKLLSAAPGTCVAAHDGARLLREAQALSRIHHPNVVDVIDHGYAEDGTPFIAMELIEGRSLFGVLHSDDAESRTWTWNRDVALQLLDGLMACHEASVVHRDIKPENILISERSGTTSGTGSWVTLVDFGIALADMPSSSSPRLTRAGSVFGTPMYMSPEQAAGSTVDLRTDIYAFGCVLHEMLSGEPPFVGTPSQVLAAHLASSPPRLDRLAAAGRFPRELLKILARCLEKDPENRFQSTRALHDALAAPRLCEPVGAARRRMSRFIAAVAVAGALGSAAVLRANRSSGPPVEEFVPKTGAPVGVPIPVTGPVEAESGPPPPEEGPNTAGAASPGVETTHPAVVPASDPVARVESKRGGQRRPITGRRRRRAAPRATEITTSTATPTLIDPPTPTDPRIGELKNPFSESGDP